MVDHIPNNRKESFNNGIQMKLNLEYLRKVTLITNFPLRAFKAAIAISLFENFTKPHPFIEKKEEERKLLKQLSWVQLNYEKNLNEIRVNIFWEEIWVNIPRLSLDESLIM